MIIPLLVRALPYLAAVAVLLILVYGIYRHGYSEGTADLQVLWDQEREEHEKAIRALEVEYARKEMFHRAENARITHELAEAEKAHDVALAEQRAEYDRRLLGSNRRAEVYQRQAESGAAQCRDLAGHAARLDRSLEEGRGLVADLRRTLELRDEQLRQLGRQILNDRSLLDETSVTDGTR